MVVCDQGPGIAGLVADRLASGPGVLVLGLQDFHGPVGVPAVVVLEAGEFGVAVVLFSDDGNAIPVALLVGLPDSGDQVVVFGGHGDVVQVGEFLHAERCRLPLAGVPQGVLPTPGAVAGRKQELAVLPRDGIVHEDPDLRAQQLQVAEVAGEQDGAFGGDGQRIEHYVVADEAVPSVEPAPPLAPAVFADPAGRSDVVGHDAAVAPHPFHPGLRVLQHPLPVLLLAGVQVCVGDQGGGAQAVGDVAVEDDVVEQLEDRVPAFGVFEPVRLQVLDHRVQGCPHAVVAV